MAKNFHHFEKKLPPVNGNDGKNQVNSSELAQSLLDSTFFFI